MEKEHFLVAVTVDVPVYEDNELMARTRAVINVREALKRLGLRWENIDAVVRRPISEVEVNVDPDPAAVFLADVRARLPAIDDKQDAETLDINILQQHKEGWTVDEAVSHAWCLEEVNPSLDERVALERMRIVREAVKARLARG